MYFHKQKKVAWCANARTGSRWQRDVLFGDRGGKKELSGRGFEKHEGHHSGPFLSPFLDKSWTIGMVVRDPYAVIISFFYGEPRNGRSPSPSPIGVDWLSQHRWASNPMMYENLWQAKGMGCDVWTYRYEHGLVNGMELFLDSLDLPQLSPFERRHKLGVTGWAGAPYSEYFTTKGWEYVQKMHGVERKLLGYE